MRENATQLEMGKYPPIGNPALWPMIERARRLHGVIGPEDSEWLGRLGIRWDAEAPRPSAPDQSPQQAILNQYRNAVIDDDRGWLWKHFPNPQHPAQQYGGGGISPEQNGGPGGNYFYGDTPPTKPE